MLIRFKEISSPAHMRLRTISAAGSLAQTLQYAAVGPARTIVAGHSGLIGSTSQDVPASTYLLTLLERFV